MWLPLQVSPTFRKTLTRVTLNVLSLTIQVGDGHLYVCTHAHTYDSNAIKL